MPFIEELIDAICCNSYRCYPPEPSWRSPSSVLIDTCADRICHKSRLDIPAFQYHVGGHRQNTCGLVTSTTLGALSILEKMVSLRQQHTDLSIQRTGVDFHVRPM